MHTHTKIKAMSTVCTHSQRKQKYFDWNLGGILLNDI